MTDMDVELTTLSAEQEARAEALQRARDVVEDGARHFEVKMVAGPYHLIKHGYTAVGAPDAEDIVAVSMYIIDGEWPWEIESEAAEDRVQGDYADEHPPPNEVPW
jgi:hypothetical protein